MKETKIKIGNVRQMTDEDIVDIGYRIREARKKAGMSQRELAEYFGRVGQRYYYRLPP